MDRLVFLKEPQAIRFIPSQREDIETDLPANGELQVPAPKLLPELRNELLTNLYRVDSGMARSWLVGEKCLERNVVV